MILLMLAVMALLGRWLFAIASLACFGNGLPYLGATLLFVFIATLIVPPKNSRSSRNRR